MKYSEQILSRRERQIMDVLFAEGEASVNRLHELLPRPPAHTAIRTMLKILEGKQLIRRRKVGREYFYASRTRRETAGRSAFQRVLRTFFDGSPAKALGAHLFDGQAKISAEELEQIEAMIRKAREGEDR